MAEAEGTPEPAPPHHIMPPVFGERGQTLFGHSAKNQGQAPVSDVQGKNEEYEEGDHTVCVCVCECIHIYKNTKYICTYDTYVCKIH